MRKKQFTALTIVLLLMAMMCTFLASCDLNISFGDKEVLEDLQFPSPETHDGEYILTISDLSEWQRDELFESLPEDYRQYASKYGGSGEIEKTTGIRIRNVEEYDFISLVNMVEYENASFGLEAMEYSIGTALTLEEASDFIRKAAFRHAETTMTVWYYDEGRGIELSIESIHDSFDIEKAREILGDGIRIYTDGHFTYCTSGTKKDILDYYNDRVNTLKIKNNARYYRDPSNWLDIENMNPSLTWIEYW